MPLEFQIPSVKGEKGQEWIFSGMNYMYTVLTTLSYVTTVQCILIWHVTRTQSGEMSLRDTKRGQSDQNFVFCIVCTAQSLLRVHSFGMIDPDQDQWSKITRITVHQRNREIPSGQEFLGSFNWCTMIRVILDHWSWSGSSQRNTPLLSVLQNRNEPLKMCYSYVPTTCLLVWPNPWN